MATNYTQPGTILTLTAPTGGVVSGTAYQIGSLVVVAQATVAQTLPFPALVKGVVNVAKVADEVWTENLAIYFDESAGKFTEDDDTAANPLVGVAVLPVAAEILIESDALAADLSIDGSVVTVLDYAALEGATVTVTVGGVSTVLTEADSGDWEAATGNDETATSLAAAIEAVSGINDATAVSAVITVTPGTGATSVTPSIGAVRLDGVAR
jgi:predicted RecA/RadA family phage recombinase